MACISNLVVLLDFLSAKSYQNFNYMLDIHKMFMFFVAC